MEITTDPSTWPSGNKTWALAHAIALTEGANIAGDVPDVLSNPGDISDYLKEYGGEYHDGSYVTRFPDKQTGWNALYQKLDNIRQGRSVVYSASMTFMEFAGKWAGNSSQWAADVTSILGVPVNSTLADYWNS